MAKHNTQWLTGTPFCVETHMKNFERINDLIREVYQRQGEPKQDAGVEEVNMWDFVQKSNKRKLGTKE